MKTLSIGTINNNNKIPNNTKFQINLTENIQQPFHNIKIMIGTCHQIKIKTPNLICLNGKDQSPNKTIFFQMIENCPGIIKLGVNQQITQKGEFVSKKITVLMIVSANFDTN